MIAFVAMALIILGLFLIIHDVLFHLGLWKLKIGRPFYLFGKIRIYHAYIGLFLIFLGLVLLK